MVFDAIYETDEIYGQSHIIHVLRGANTEKIRKARHDDLECFGCGKTYSKALWQSLIRQLVSTGFLDIDIAGYGGLKITKKGNDLSRGKETFFYRKQEVETAVKGARKKKPTTVASRDISDRDLDLLSALKQKRLLLAKGRGVPAYVIFPDKTLEDMAITRPSNLGEMIEIKGVGKAKLKNFGNEFLTVITENT